MLRYLWFVQNGNGECVGEARIGDDSQRRCHGHCQRLCHLLLFFALCKLSTVAIAIALSIPYTALNLKAHFSPNQYPRFTFGLLYTSRLNLFRTGSCYSHPTYYNLSSLSKNIQDYLMGELTTTHLAPIKEVITPQRSIWKNVQNNFIKI